MPRIPELPDSLDERQQALYDRIRSGARGRVRGPLALWLRSPELCERIQVVGEYLRFGSTFPADLSELAIIVAAKRHRCAYEWYVHAPLAIKGGVSADAVEAIRTGAPPAFADEAQRDLYDFCSELVARDRVSDALFDRFHRRFGDRGVIEVTAILGYYAVGAYLLNAVAFETPDGTDPFSG